MKLNKVAEEIREIITQKQIEFGLSFEEENHKYTMNGRTDYPSVSKVLKKFNLFLGDNLPYFFSYFI